VIDRQRDSAAVVALAGPIASGKTTVARYVARSLGVPRVSFGRFVASTQPDSASREALQRAGAALLSELGTERFVSAVLATHGLTREDTPVVWDGLRHVEVLEALRRAYAPREVTLCYLAPPEHVRRERAAALAGSEDRLSRWEQHSTEGIAQLRELASVVCQDPTPTLAAQRILRALGAANPPTEA